MHHAGFFKKSGPLRLDEIAELTGSRPPADADGTRQLHAACPLGEAGPDDVSFLDNPNYLSALEATRAGACFVAEKHAGRCPVGTIPLVSDTPYEAFALTLQALYPGAAKARSAFGDGVCDGAQVHASAQLESDVAVEPNAVIGPEAQIGRGTVISAGAVVGHRVTIGRDCFLGPNTSVTHALLGDRVILQAGVRVGSDGFGFAMSKTGHVKVPQIGRVIIQDDVEVGANSTIDRGALADTIIGEGTKIDNLVQIAHNVVVGRHCIIVSQVGISGSTEIGDFAVLAGQAGIAGHLKIGAGAQLGAQAGLMHNVPPGERWSGYPAQPVRAWLREVALLRSMIKNK